MRAERIRIKRLQRLEKVRAMAKHSAAQAAAQAEGTLSQLAALAERTRHMAASYRGRTSQRDGFELRQSAAFGAGLDAILVTTSGDVAKAQALADARQHDLALAERSRAAVEDRVEAAQRMLSLRGQSPALGPRKAVGTPLE